jgi:hypothetical protein
MHIAATEIVHRSLAWALLRHDCLTNRQIASIAAIKMPLGLAFMTWL